MEAGALRADQTIPVILSGWFLAPQILSNRLTAGDFFRLVIIRGGGRIDAAVTADDHPRRDARPLPHNGDPAVDVPRFQFVGGIVLARA